MMYLWYPHRHYLLCKRERDFCVFPVSLAQQMSSLNTFDFYVPSHAAVRCTDDKSRIRKCLCEILWLKCLRSLLTVENLVLKTFCSRRSIFLHFIHKKNLFWCFWKESGQISRISLKIWLENYGTRGCDANSICWEWSTVENLCFL